MLWHKRAFFWRHFNIERFCFNVEITCWRVTGPGVPGNETIIQFTSFNLTRGQLICLTFQGITNMILLIFLTTNALFVRIFAVICDVTSFKRFDFIISHWTRKCFSSSTVLQFSQILKLTGKFSYLPVSSCVVLGFRWLEGRSHENRLYKEKNSRKWYSENNVKFSNFCWF